MAEQSRAKRLVFEWAIATGRRVRRAQRAGRPVRRDLAWQHRLADRLVLAKVRDLFGGRIEVACTGAAPIAKEVLEFFDACGVLVLEGWGMTETAAAGAINTVEELRFGTVGRSLPSAELRVAEDGELLMRGPMVFRGYFKDDEATQEAMAGGWLATGDIAEIDGDGFVSITGRKKELIITSSGKNISPSNIENLLKENRWISQALVFGDNRPYLVALLTLDAEEAPKLAERLGIDAEIATMAHDPRVVAALQEVVDEVNTHLARIEQIKRFKVLELTRMHHCIADGVALARVLLSLTDDAPDAGIATTAIDEPHGRAEALAAPARAGAHAAEAAIHEGFELAIHPTTEAADLVSRATAGGRALGKLLLTGPDAGTVFKGRLGAARKVSWTDPIELAAVKRTGHATGTTVNDVLLTAMTGALHRYLADRDSVVDEIRAMVPFNLRACKPPGRALTSRSYRRSSI